MAHKTEEAIANSLKKLLQKKPLNKITISDIADDCGINRMTFYYHFKDIYDLVEWICNEIADKSLEGSINSKAWTQGLSKILNAVLEERVFFSAIYHSLEHTTMEKYIYKVFNVCILGTSKEFVGDRNISEEDLKFIADFYTYAFTGILMQWIGTGFKKTPDELVEKISTIMNGTIKRSVDLFV